MNGFIRHGVTVLLILILVGCAGVSQRQVPPTSPVPLTGLPQSMNLKVLCERFNAGWEWDSISQVITVTNEDRIIKALVGSDVVIADQQKLILSAPIIVLNSEIIVPADFVRVMAYAPKPVDRPRQRLSKNRLKIARTVVIDAGHGGMDPGALARLGSMNEKEVVLDIANRVAALLKREHVEVVMTRDRDEFISLKDRAQMASKAKADLFVSIHANSHPKSSVSGLEVYTLRELSAYERKEQQRRDSLRQYFRGLQMVSGKPEIEGMVADLLYNNKQAESVRLAGIMGADTSRLVKTKNHGVKESRFFVLRNTVVPAVLIEVGFLSNEREERLLGTGSYRQKLAEGVVSGILAFMHE